MRQVGIVEAKANFSALLSEVESKGESVVITRHGRPVATLTPGLPTPARRRWSEEEWTRIVAEHRRAQDEWAKRHPQLLEPFDLRAERDAIESSLNL